MDPVRLPHDHGNVPQGVQEEMPSSGSFENIADTCKLLADGKRTQLFWLLCHCEECVINLSALMEMSSPAVSHHLKQLRAAGLIVSRREGKEVYYKASDARQTRLLHDMLKQMVHLTCPAHCG